MATPCLLLCLSVLSGLGTFADDRPEDNRPRPTAENAKQQPLAEQFAALKLQFETREKGLRDELDAANELDAEARSQKIADENQKFNRDWEAMEEKVRALIRAHPADPAAFDGIILLPGAMRGYLDDDLVKIVRKHFLNDPRMGQLCASLVYDTEDEPGTLLKDVAVRHPDRRVRGQALYSLGLASYFMTDKPISDRARTDHEKDLCLTAAKRYFTQVTIRYPDVTSADGTFRLADKARAELTRIDNLPNLKVGKVAPEITGEDLSGRPLKLSDHRGKVVVVCFWATWCGPCMAMVPHERELVERMAGKPFALLGVNSDEADDHEQATATTREEKMTWPSWWDGGVWGPIQTAYNVRHWPTIYVLDPGGVIRYIDIRGKDLDKAVDTLLAEKEAGSRRDVNK
jgi:thiol-disulfide isomerase/thioredoxin